ncbi:terminase TerL endonuclease subunit [uncultured Sphingomonas sp.]|uniref:terminase large subunit n=1 Tax=uncultured Sphingomonas sp. TaxID=158754 RepID=UPI0025FB8F4B|nr:terminase TerL endonuclease subunit [uncultured Sphingomonas sp.]
MEARSYVLIAKEYARDVVAGRIPACKSIRLQAKRFLDELKIQKRAAFPYRFDEAKAAKVCRFIELLPHSKGKWARKKELLTLQPWQVWILCCTFGWLHKAGERAGMRRYRVLFVVVPRKNGKSALSAGVALYMLCADGEFGAEVYSGATNEKQAKEVFTPAKLMASRTPDLLEHYGVEVLASSLVRSEDNSKLETIVGDPGDGQSPSCSIHDEYHEHKDDGQVDTMQTGMGARDQPLQILITTAGDNLAGPCYASILDERQKLAGVGLVDDAKAARVAAGLAADGPRLEDETFFVEYTIDEGDDWKSEAALRKANPNFGVSVDAEFLKARQRDAIATPRKAGVFKTKHLNLWVAAKAAYYDVEAWRKCKRDDVPMRAAGALEIEALRGRRAIASLDLASKWDIAAVEVIILPIGDEPTKDDPIIRLGWYFLPEETVANVPAYQQWDTAGLINVTQGEIIDYDEIVELLHSLKAWFQLEHVGYDPHQATMMATTLQKAGFPVVEVGQTVLNLSEPMKELDAWMRAGLIAHGGDAVMEWQIANVTGAPDKKDNVYPNKPRADAKIDNPVALMAAIRVRMSAEPEAVFEYTGI